MEPVDVVDVEDDAPPTCVGGVVAWPRDEVDVRAIWFDRQRGEFSVVAAK